MAENDDEAVDGAEQTEERADADGDFKNDDAAFHGGDLGAGAGLERFHVLGLGPRHVLEAGGDEPGEGGFLAGGELLDQGGVFAVAEIHDGLGKRRLDDEGAAQGEGSFQHDGDRKNGAQDDGDHERAALDEETEE